VNKVAIPAWTADGVLPPINAAQPTSVERSPYIVSLTDYVLRFSDTTERRAVLSGFLNHRAALHKVGLVEGFQWLNGSFLEQVELLEGRPPNDLDVVTFYRLPEGKTQRDILDADPSLFDHDQLKTHYRVDAYFADLGTQAEQLTRRSVYWYSMWSHRRNRVWKGFVQVDLAPTEDASALATLATAGSQGDSP
jgi:hypothetical protein